MYIYILYVCMYVCMYIYNVIYSHLLDSQRVCEFAHKLAEHVSVCRVAYARCCLERRARVSRHVHADHAHACSLQDCAEIAKVVYRARAAVDCDDSAVLPRALCVCVFACVVGICM